MSDCSVSKEFAPDALIYSKLNYCCALLVVIAMKVRRIDVDEVILSAFFVANDVFK